MTLDPTKVLPEFLAMLDQPTIIAAMRRDKSPHRELTARVLREYPFACRFERTLISGIIDRLVLWSSGDRVVAAELLDFKTDVVLDDPSLAARVETYRPQLDSYRRAVTQLFGLSFNQVATKLIFVQRGEVVEV